MSLYGYSKNGLKQPLKKKTKIGFQDRLSLNAGQKYCRMLQGEHSALLSIFIKLLHVIKIFVLSILEWTLKTGFTVFSIQMVKVYIISIEIEAIQFCIRNRSRLLRDYYYCTCFACMCNLFGHSVTPILGRNCVTFVVR